MAIKRPLAAPISWMLAMTAPGSPWIFATAAFLWLGIMFAYTFADYLARPAMPESLNRLANTCSAGSSSRIALRTALTTHDERRQAPGRHLCRRLGRVLISHNPLLDLQLFPHPPAVIFLDLAQFCAIHTDTEGETRCRVFQQNGSQQ